MHIALDLQACQAVNADRGIGRYSMMLAQTMARQALTNGRGHELSIILNNNLAERANRVIQAFSDLVPRSRIHVFDVPQGSQESGADSAWSNRAAERIREHYLSKLKPDIVHIASLFEGWDDDATGSVALGVNHRATSTAITLYDLIPLMRSDIYLSNPKVSDWYYRKLQSLKNADLLLGISAFSAAEVVSVLQLPREQVVNISSAIDTIFVPRTLSTDASTALRQRYGIRGSYVMYTGGIDFRKNIEGLIEAFARMPRRLIEAHQLVIVCKADQHDRDRLQSVARRFKLAPDRLILSGYVPDDDLVSLYNEASLFIFPSLYEGFGLPVLEAMACGTPVIGANNSSIPEVIGRKDALFDASKIETITEKLSQVLNDENMRRELAAHGQERAKLFSWDLTAQRSLDAFEAAHDRRMRINRALLGPAKLPSTLPPVAPRPRLAVISPLPPERSGIADYTAELLPELIRYYQVDVIITGDVQDPWTRANCQMRTLSWFEQHGEDYDHLLYHFGNSHMHAHMFELLEKFPGVVVLHDFFLSGAVYDWSMMGDRDNFVRALYNSHGYPALASFNAEDYAASTWKYPLNKQVLDDATGVIVHSAYSQSLAREWYGPAMARDWAVIPLLRGAANVDRAAAQQKLSLAPNDHLTCSFGLLGQTKQNHELLQAWVESSLGRSGSGRLVFVGQRDGGAYGATLDRLIAESGCADRIKITGFVSAKEYEDYLCAADIAVQLRSRTRGETSRTILDCLAYGVPTIINANGSAAEQPDDVLIKLPDAFTQEALSASLSHLAAQPQTCQRLAEASRRHIAKAHHPYQVGLAYREALERFSTSSDKAQTRILVRDLARIAIAGSPSPADLAGTARAIALNQQQPAPPAQLLIDISQLVGSDRPIESLSNAVSHELKALLLTEIAGYRIELVRAQDGQYHYARSLAAALLGWPNRGFTDLEIDSRPGDLLVMIAAADQARLPLTATLLSLKNRGIHLHTHCMDPLNDIEPNRLDDAVREQTLRSQLALSDSISAQGAYSAILNDDYLTQHAVDPSLLVIGDAKETLAQWLPAWAERQCQLQSS